jgi:hypothetical protein
MRFARSSNIYLYVEMASIGGSLGQSRTANDEASCTSLLMNCSVLLRKSEGNGSDWGGANHWYLDGLKIGLLEDFDFPNGTTRDAYLLLISKSPPHRDLYSFDCLILQRTRMKAGEYRRTGYIQLLVPTNECEMEGDDRVFYERLRAGTLGRHESLQAEEYVKNLRGDMSQFQYQIEII